MFIAFEQHSNVLRFFLNHNGHCVLVLVMRIYPIRGKCAFFYFMEKYHENVKLSLRH